MKKNSMNLHIFKTVLVGTILELKTESKNFSKERLVTMGNSSDQNW